MLVFEAATFVVASNHGKESVIAPVVTDTLRATRFVPCVGLDTERFGTFTGEVARTGTMLDAALPKATRTLELTLAADVAIASEGSFGP